MAALVGFQANRWVFQLGKMVEPTTFKRLFSKINPSYVGSPQYPLPGTETYSESIKRLQDPRVLEMLSRKSKNLSSSELKTQEWMQQISHQNLQLIESISRLERKVEKLENLIGAT